MAIPELKKIWLYRIVHIDNIEYLLEHGMFHRSHPNADLAYINIGDNTLIRQRDDYDVLIDPPNGLLGKYIPFYFGKLSPMLLNIKTGHRGIVKRPQEEIVYICCNVGDIIECCGSWCFTDGHAKNALTTFYNDISNLDLIDFDLVKARYWHNTELDLDRMRKKQAEFLVKSHVPPQCIRNIVVYDEKANEKITKLVNESKSDIVVHTSKSFYY